MKKYKKQLKEVNNLLQKQQQKITSLEMELSRFTKRLQSITIGIIRDGYDELKKQTYLNQIHNLINHDTAKDNSASANQEISNEYYRNPNL